MRLGETHILHYQAILCFRIHGSRQNVPAVKDFSIGSIDIERTNLIFCNGSDHSREIIDDQ